MRHSSQRFDNDLLSLVQDLDVRIVSLLHVGGDGCLKRLDFAPSAVAFDAAFAEE